MIVGAAFSFDWALVQPQVSKLTQVCTFDPSGTAWSDPFPSRAEGDAAATPGTNASNSTPTCADRVDEVHRLLQRAPIQGPYVLAGFSIGALWARLYALEYPDSTVGMVLVDHAFLGPDYNGTAGSEGPAATPNSPRPPNSKSTQDADSPPILISTTPITIGFEDDSNFNKLSERDQQLHLWAMRQNPTRPTAEMAADCFALVDKITSKRAYPLGNMDLVVVSTDNDAPGYKELQNTLLSLSHRSEHVIAHNSSHMVPIDDPGVIVSAISEVVKRERAGGASTIR
jgi:pimeloyl-ACP methyl ester carboxylesterase